MSIVLIFLDIMLKPKLCRSVLIFLSSGVNQSCVDRFDISRHQVWTNIVSLGSTLLNTEPKLCRLVRYSSTFSLKEKLSRSLFDISQHLSFRVNCRSLWHHSTFKIEPKVNVDRFQMCRYDKTPAWHCWSMYLPIKKSHYDEIQPKFSVKYRKNVRYSDTKFFVSPCYSYWYIARLWG